MSETAITAQIAKFDEERRLVFGWASISVEKDGTDVVDSFGDVIDVSDLEDAAYEFTASFGAANEMHAGPPVGRLVESFIVTPEKLEKLGVPAGTLPLGWWTGFRIDEATFAKVKDGTLKAFSIEGKATRTPE